MKILGISSNYHDASASLVIDGVVVASSSEERFTTQKHDPSFPRFSIEYCLKSAQLTSEQIDLVVYHEDPHSKFTRSLSSAFKNFPFSLSTFIKSAKDMMTSGFWIKHEISKFLNIHPSKVIFIPHHMSHAAHAFLSSPFEEASILTIDAVGEWYATCLFKATKSEGVFKIEPIELTPFPHSLGLVYSAFTGFLGFKVNDGECSTMALAAFGKPIYKKEIEKIIILKADGRYDVDLSYFNFSSDSKLPLTEKFVSIFGEPRSFKSPLLFDSINDELIDHGIDHKRYADIAASLQSVLEDAVVGLARRLKSISPSDNLCYAGGVALNCVANSRLVENKIFKNIYIPPDPGDGGGAMGAALYGSLIYDSINTKPRCISPYLGASYLPDELKKLIEYVDPSDWSRFSKVKIRPLKKENIKTHEFSNSAELCSFVARKIADDKIVGWFQGRFENGPRALGNRSILCRADSINVAKKLSEKVKLRAKFRPYACSITYEEARNVFVENEFSLEKWMQSSFSIKKDHVQKLRAAAHIDHTTRAQIVEESDNPLYFQLLTEMKKHLGIAAVLNTSFNEQGFPLVAAPIDAFINFARTDLDLLVIENFVIEKVL